MLHFAQPVHDVHHAVSVPDHVEHERNEVAMALGPYRPGQGDHPVMNGHDDVLGVGDRDLVENLADVVGDVGVGAQEDAQQVASAHDADELAVPVDYRQPPDVVRVHQPGCPRDGRVGAYGDGRRGHQIG